MTIRYLRLLLILISAVSWTTAAPAADTGANPDTPSGAHAHATMTHTRGQQPASTDSSAMTACHQTAGQQQSHACGTGGTGSSGQGGMMHGGMRGGMHGMMGGMGCGMMRRQLMQQMPQGVLANYLAESANGRTYSFDSRRAEHLVQYVWKQGLPCLNCHTVGEPAYGPPFSAVAAFYKARPDANNLITSRISYGFGRMPAGIASAEQAAALANLILALSPAEDGSDTVQ